MDLDKVGNKIINFKSTDKKDFFQETVLIQEFIHFQTIQVQQTHFSKKVSMQSEKWKEDFFPMIMNKEYKDFFMKEAI